MSLLATVIPVMIASPGDVHSYRAIARDVLHEWNYIHTVSRHLVLMPTGWETHSSPELGGSAQELINDRVLEDCDVLIGIFWTRLGTPTATAPSGTVDEIKRHVAAGKPALIYFSSQPVAPESIDQKQYSALTTFREWCKSQGLVETFSEENDFREKLRRQIQIALNDNPHLKTIVEAATKPSRPLTSVAPAAPMTRLALEAAPSATLCTEAVDLLVAAAEDASGLIVVIHGLAGNMLQAGQKTFGEPQNNRVMARWEYGIEQLVTLGFVEQQRNESGHMRIYKVNERGYRAAEQIGASA
jgi:hypothetical protein